MSETRLISLVAQHNGVSVKDVLGRGKKQPLPDARLQLAALLYASGFKEWSIASQLDREYPWAYQCRQRFIDRITTDREFYESTEKLWLKVLDTGLFKLDTSRIQRNKYD